MASWNWCLLFGSLVVVFFYVPARLIVVFTKDNSRIEKRAALLMVVVAWDSNKNVDDISFCVCDEVEFWGKQKESLIVSEVCGEGRESEEWR